MFSRLILLFVASAGLSPLLSPAFAGSCPDQAQRTVLLEFRDELAAAATPEEARERALGPVRVAQAATDRVGRLFPHHAEVEAAGAQLAGLEQRISAAPDQAAVAAEVDQIASNAALNCDYTNVEVVIIVVGFILGILPGILFLFLFC